MILNIEILDEAHCAAKDSRLWQRCNEIASQTDSALDDDTAIEQSRLIARALFCLVDAVQQKQQRFSEQIEDLGELYDETLSSEEIAALVTRMKSEPSYRMRVGKILHSFIKPAQHVEWTLEERLRKLNVLGCVPKP